MAWFSVGKSSYGDLRGVEQFTNSERIALQFYSLKRDFDELPSSKTSGAKLSVNEARRSRPRQSYLWANRFVLGVTVAPPFTSPHDEVNHGNALDVGVTMPDGSNRALTDAEFAWMHEQCELRGFTWTGRNFGEPWHIEGATRTELKAPYPNARPIAPAPAAASAAKIIVEIEDMARIIQDPNTKKYYLENFAFGVAEPLAVGKDDLNDLTKLLKGNGKLPIARINDLNERYFRKGVMGMFNLGVREGVFTKAGK